jgi:Mn2+/Fe2+ NRAMP family transporter
VPTYRRYLRRPHLYRRAGLVALAAVVGPGLLAGLSDDDPPGITTYSVLGADFGYGLLWVLVLSTATLIVFHLLAARVGIVTGRGLTGLVRHRYGARSALGSAIPLVLANIGTTCAELAGIAAAAEIAGIPRAVAVPAVSVGVTAFVVSGTFHRVEHVFLALSAALAAYIVAGILSGPDWHAAAHGMAVPSLPAGRHALVLVSATIGTTLAPWGLAFMQSYCVDKKLKIEDWRFERLDVVAGAVMTGIVGFFIVVACAETLHAHGLHVNDASDAARALRPLAGNAASALFAVGLFGAALLATAILPLSTAYSVSEATGRSANVDAGLRDEPFFYGTYILVLVVATAVVLSPVGLVALLVLSQVLNAFLLLPLMAVLVRLSRDPSVMGEHVSGPAGTVAAVAGMLLVAVSSATLAIVALLG